MTHSKNWHLNRNIIEQALGDHAVVELTILEQTTSTNDYLLYRTGAEVAGFYVCLAESQTAGRGRRGCKVWDSPDNGNLYLSVLYQGQAVPEIRVSGWLSLAVAIEVVAALGGEYGVDDLSVKWPNDIYRAKGKLGGVLVESRHDRCVAGLGLNIYPPADGDWRSDVAWASLSESRIEESAGKSFERERLAALMIVALMHAFDRTRQKPEDALVADWQRYDLLANREVTVSTASGRFTGIARGLDKNGGLQVEHGSGDMRVYYSEEVSVRW